MKNQNQCLLNGCWLFAGIAQLVERNLAKVEVDGSRPFSRSKFWRDSKAVMPRIANPVSPVRLWVSSPRGIRVIALGFEDL